jgi:hypothetical protein
MTKVALSARTGLTSPPPLKLISSIHERQKVLIKPISIPPTPRRVRRNDIASSTRAGNEIAALPASRSATLARQYKAVLEQGHPGTEPEAVRRHQFRRASPCWVHCNPPGSHWERWLQSCKPVGKRNTFFGLLLKTHQFGGVHSLSLKLAWGVERKFDFRKCTRRRIKRHMIAELNYGSSQLIVMDGVDIFVDGGR